jgi:hypothetical protein
MVQNFDKSVSTGPHGKERIYRHSGILSRIREQVVPTAVFMQK